MFQTDNFKSAQALVFTNRIPSNDGLELFNPKNPNVNIILTDDVKVSTDFIAEKITTSGGADLDSVKSVLQNFINFFNAHVHPSNGAPPLPPGFVPSWGASKSRVEEVDDEQ